MERDLINIVCITGLKQREMEYDAIEINNIKKKSSIEDIAAAGYEIDHSDESTSENSFSVLNPIYIGIDSYQNLEIENETEI